MDAILMVLLFGCIWIAVAVGIGNVFSRKSRFDPQDREQLGLLERQRAESRVRVERAMARHNGRAT